MSGSAPAGRGRHRRTPRDSHGAAVALVTLPLLLSAAAPAPVVRVEAGAIRGEQLADRAQFRGIPFAAPPVGPLRWRAPAPVASWRGVRDATRSAPACAQLSDGWNKADADGSAEDCLYLEVATPSLRPARPLPVFVWIHGGSNKAGGGSGAVGSSLLRHGIVLVSIQYRLGPLGFMAHPALSRESGGTSGNYGLMDQQAALRWVRRNIAAFGGDPAQVTIGGESAGAMDVALHQVMPGSRGLFRAAIEESGTASFGFPSRSLAASEAIGEEIAAQTGHPHASAAELRALPAAALLAAARRIATPAGLPEPGTVWLQAEVDGRVITEAPANTLAAGQGQRVPLLIGANAREIDFFHDPAAARAALAVFGARAGAAARAYGLDRRGTPPGDPVRGPVTLQVGTDTVFTCPTFFTADARARAGVPVWRYDFGYQPAAGPPLSHASEVRYVFGRAGEDGIPADAPPLQGWWANFIKRGDPNGPGPAFWPQHGAAANYLAIGAGAPVVRTGTRPACEGWDRP